MSGILPAACDPRDVRRVSPWRFREDFRPGPQVDGFDWGASWVNVRYETPLSLEDGAGIVEIEAAPQMSLRPHAPYMAAPVLLDEAEVSDVTVQVDATADGPVEVGPIVRVNFDSGYALVAASDEVRLYRYTAVGRELLDHAPLRVDGAWVRLRLETRGDVASGTARIASGETVELSARDPDPLEPGLVGVLANPTDFDRPGVGSFRRFRAAARDGASQPPVPRVLYSFTGAIVQEDESVRARLSARTNLPLPISFEIAEDENFVDARITDPVEPQGRFGAVRAWVEGLEPHRKYYWRARAAHRGREVIGPAMSLRTPPRAGDPVRFVFGSCTSGIQTAYTSFSTAAATDPHFYLHSGDWGYADMTGFARRADHFQARWSRLLRAPEIAGMLRTTPLMFWQDDHDYDTRNGWSGEIQQYAVDAFDDVHANPTDEFFDVRWGDVHVWCLDCRRYADDPRLPDDENKSRIGERQKRWLKDGMAASDAPVQIVASAMVFRNKRDNDFGWHNVYATERDELLAFFSELDKTVAILSGDAHGQRLIHHREFGELYEVTSSGTDFDPGVGQGDNDPSYTLVHEDESGFALVELSPAGPDRELRIRTINRVDGSTIFEKKLPVRT